MDFKVFDILLKLDVLFGAGCRCQMRLIPIIQVMFNMEKICSLLEMNYFFLNV